MLILNQVFMIAGLGTAFYFGYAGFGWYFIFISGVLFTLGWAVVRPGGIIHTKHSYGILGLIKLFTIQMMFMSLFGSILYFIGYLLG
jgi:hypothetical protein